MCINSCLISGCGLKVIIVLQFRSHLPPIACALVPGSGLPNNEKKFTKLMEKFQEYGIPRNYLTWERHVFNTRNQHPDETIDQYVTDLYNKAKTHEFGGLTESLIKDRFVCGVLSDKTRLWLFKKPREMPLIFVKRMNPHYHKSSY